MIDNLVEDESSRLVLNIMLSTATTSTHAQTREWQVTFPSQNPRRTGFMCLTSVLRLLPEYF